MHLICVLLIYLARNISMKRSLLSPKHPSTVRQCEESLMIPLKGTHPDTDGLFKKEVINDLRIDLLTARLVVNFFLPFWRFYNRFTRNKVIHQRQRCRFYFKLLAPCSRFACVFLVAVLFSITYHDISR